MASKKTAPAPEVDENALKPSDEYLRDSVEIDPLDMHNAFIEMPGLLAYWNERYATALRAFLFAKLDVDTMKGQLQPIVRQAIADAGGKPTEAMVEAAILANEGLIDLKEKLIEAEVTKNEIFGALDAVRSKKEMLISLGAQLRAEMGSDPLIRDQVAASRERMYGDREG